MSFDYWCSLCFTCFVEESYVTDSTTIAVDYYSTSSFWNCLRACLWRSCCEVHYSCYSDQWDRILLGATNQQFGYICGVWQIDYPNFARNCNSGTKSWTKSQYRSCQLPSLHSISTLESLHLSYSFQSSFSSHLQSSADLRWAESSNNTNLGSQKLVQAKKPSALLPGSHSYQPVNYLKSQRKEVISKGQKCQIVMHLSAPHLSSSNSGLDSKFDPFHL